MINIFLSNYPQKHYYLYLILTSYEKEKINYNYGNNYGIDCIYSLKYEQ